MTFVVQTFVHTDILSTPLHQTSFLIQSHIFETENFLRLYRITRAIFDWRITMISIEEKSRRDSSPFCWILDMWNVPALTAIETSCNQLRRTPGLIPGSHDMGRTLDRTQLEKRSIVLIPLRLRVFQ